MKNRLFWINNFILTTIKIYHSIALSLYALSKLEIVRVDKMFDYVHGLIGTALCVKSPLVFFHNCNLECIDLLMCNIACHCITLVITY